MRERGAERDSIQSKCTKLKTVAKHFLIYVVLGWAGVPRQSGGVGSAQEPLAWF